VWDVGIGVRDVQCYWCISQFASTPRFEGIDKEIERQTDNVPCDSSSSSSMVMSNDRHCSSKCSELSAGRSFLTCMISALPPLSSLSMVVATSMPAWYDLDDDRSSGKMSWSTEREGQQSSSAAIWLHCVGRLSSTAVLPCNTTAPIHQNIH
jgi:hypothetical protein